MIDPDRISALCAAGGIRVVRMRRANLVKAAVSQIRARRYAERTGDWAVRPGMTPLEPIPIDPALLLERIHQMDHADRRLMGMFEGCTVIDVEYQELLDDLVGVAHRVREVLGVPQRPFRVLHEKATPDDLAAAIPNLDEVAGALAGTPWADQLAAPVA
jgi:LPS sulfotransferase NodH